MVDSTHIAFAVVTIAIISCVAIFHAQLVDLKTNKGQPMPTSTSLPSMSLICGSTKIDKHNHILAGMPQ